MAPLPDEPLTWAGVLFIRSGELIDHPQLKRSHFSSQDAAADMATGPYANAILRFRIDFPDVYPEYPPTVTILSDVFHPLVSPLTTYSYSTRDTGAEGVSAADRHRLPPGGLSLRHGFPEWFERSRGGVEVDGLHSPQQRRSGTADRDVSHSMRKRPLTLEILQYLRVIFSTDAVLDTVSLDDAVKHWGLARLDKLSC